MSDETPTGHTLKLMRAEWEAPLRAEIERLRDKMSDEEIDGFRQALIDEKAANQVLRTEVERLREHMRALANTSVDRDTAGIFQGLWQGAEKECHELNAEIERLRAALRGIAEQTAMTAMVVMARRALEGK